MKIFNESTEQRRKWWEIACTQDEVDLFTSIARNPKYDWRSVSGIIKELGWEKEKIDQVLKPFINNRMIIAKQTKKGMSIAYWERIQDELDACSGDCKSSSGSKTKKSCTKGKIK